MGTGKEGRVLSSIVRALVAAGATPEMIVAAVEAAEADAHSKAQARLQKGRERSRRYRRHAKERDVTLGDVMLRDDTSQSVRNVTGPLSPKKEIPPTPPKEKIPLSLTDIDSAREVSKLEEGELFATANGSLGASPNLFVMAEPMRWKAAGMDWLGDIIPAIRTAAAKCRPGSVQSWNYFSQAVADWHEARTKPMPKGANGNARSPRTTTADIARQLSRVAEQREAERDDGSSLQVAGLISRAG